MSIEVTVGCPPPGVGCVGVTVILASDVLGVTTTVGVAGAV
jgi:nitrogenase subunit NifH